MKGYHVQFFLEIKFQSANYFRHNDHSVRWYTEETFIIFNPSNTKKKMENGNFCVYSSSLLLSRDPLSNPPQTIIQTLSCAGTAGLNVPITVLDAMKGKGISYLRRGLVCLQKRVLQNLEDPHAGAA